MPSINSLTDDLGTLGGVNSFAYGINSSGQVIGEASTSTGAPHAFRTAANAKINPLTDDLGTLGGSQSYAYGVNSNGRVVGYAYTTGNTARHAFRTAANAAINPLTDDLGTLGGTQSYAYGINDSTGGHQDGPTQLGNTARHAFLYSGSTMNDLNDLIAPGSGWILADANGINDAGQIVGTGTINGYNHALPADAGAGTGDVGDVGRLGVFRPFGCGRPMVAVKPSPPAPLPKGEGSDIFPLAFCGGRTKIEVMNRLHIYYWYFYFSPRGFGVGGGV